MGLRPDVKLIVDGMIKASIGMVDTVMVGTRDTAIALFHELDRQHGMAGDDDAGRAFAKVYKSAAATTLDKIGFSAYVMGETGKGLMLTFHGAGEQCRRRDSRPAGGSDRRHG
ncbi:hypothetical protein [Streptomyces sp. NPDC007206]|uniref:hypothetical protein n=1 Tax=Streptomyces sp. NPDC007206 TaxID=3154317 RepID=UPI0033D4BBE1